METIESEKFYNLCQSYRHSREIPQEHVLNAYKNLIDHIDDRHSELLNILRDIHQQVDLKTLPSSIAIRIEALFGLVQDHGDPCQKNRT